VWKRYRSAPGILTPDYIDAIPWERLGPCPGEGFARALMIASDVETATYDVFFLQELASTASERDPIIAAFMKRWVKEELTHGELLRKLLKLWGYDHQYITPRFSPQTRLVHRIMRLWGNCLGEQFKFLHMIWGGINELTAREESLHANFYLGMAEAQIHSPMTRFLCRMAFRRWRPVGAWNKSDTEMRPVLELFDAEHLSDFDRNVTKEFERRFPVFAGSGLTSRLAKLIRSSRPTTALDLVRASN
jgi:hypothetical protein